MSSNVTIEVNRPVTRSLGLSACITACVLSSLLMWNYYFGLQFFFFVLYTVTVSSLLMWNYYFWSTVFCFVHCCCVITSNVGLLLCYLILSNLCWVVFRAKLVSILYLAAVGGELVLGVFLLFVHW